MSKGLEAIINLIPRFYDDLPNVSPEEYVRLGKVREELLKIIEKELKALEIIKGINFDIVYREQFDEWTLFIVVETQDGEDLKPVAFGSGKDQYDLLKEVLL